MQIQASTLSLPSIPNSKSILFDPTSQSLALTLTNSTVHLYPSFSLLSHTSFTSIPYSSSSCFVTLTFKKTLFFSASPCKNSDFTDLKAWILQSKSNLYAPVTLKFKKRIGSDKNGVEIGLKHGFGVRIVGGVNVVVVHSSSENEIWILGVRVNSNGAVELEKCAVIECVLPVYEMKTAMGMLVVGEVGGVRVFNLRVLVKGGLVGRKKAKKVVNGMVDGSENRGKLRTLKLKQDSAGLSSFFVTMNSKEVQDSDSNGRAKAISKVVFIHYLSQKKFLILDSVGDLHLLTLQNSMLASKSMTHSSLTSISGQITRLDVTMKVQLLAVHHDLSSKMQVLWLSDGAYTVHVMSISDLEHSVEETDENEKKEKEMLISAIQVIFMSETVLDIVPLSAKTILILGQGNIFAYSIF